MSEYLESPFNACMHKADCAALKAELEAAREGWHMANGVAELAMKHRDMAEAELEALRADAERLDAIERGLWFVQPRYEDVPARWTVGKAGSVNRYKTLRAAIDAAKEAP